MNIIIKNTERYVKQGNRIRKLCKLEKCNYVATKLGICKKHITTNDEKICEKCLFVYNVENFTDDMCIKCFAKNERKKTDYKTINIVRNGVRYKQFKCGVRKICKLETCSKISSGEYCRKHKPREIKEGEKQCNRCLNVKPIKEFKIENTEYHKCFYCREKHRENSLIRHQKRRKFILQIKIDMGGKCIDCNTDDLEILEFDHILGKKLTEIKKIYNYKGILQESEKCALRCSNCHSIKTKNTVIYDKINENSIYKYHKNNIERITTAREYVNHIKLNSHGCTQCGFFDENNLQVLQFDHLTEFRKEYCISRMVGQGRVLGLIQKEIDKCRLLCANCHRKHTLRQFDYPILGLISNTMLKES